MNIQVLVMIAVAAGVVLATLIFSYSPIRKIVWIVRTPPCSLNALFYEGLVKVSGKATTKDLKSPVNLTVCAYWQLEIDERKGSGRSRHWAKIYSETSRDAIGISDGMGKVGISPQGAEFVLYQDPVSEPAIDVANRFGIETKGFLGFNKSFRVIERTIEPDQDVFVLGSIVQNNGLRTIAKVEGKPLIISDRSERATLTHLYGQVAWRFLIALAVGAVLFYSFAA
jgi:hypothetical protein